MRTKATRNEILVYSVGLGICIGIIAAFLGLDIFKYFWYGMGLSYLNAEFWERFWRWWESQAPFKGFRYWFQIWQSKFLVNRTQMKVPVLQETKR